MLGGALAAVGVGGPCSPSTMLGLLLASIPARRRGVGAEVSVAFRVASMLLPGRGKTSARFWGCSLAGILGAAIAAALSGAASSGSAHPGSTGPGASGARQRENVSEYNGVHGPMVGIPEKWHVVADMFFCRKP